MKTLDINRCPVHPEYWSVSIDDENGGTRITSSKCCGQWRTVKSFRMTASDWTEAARLCEEAADEAG